MRKGEKLYYYFLEKFGLPSTTVGPSSLILRDSEMSHIILELFHMRDCDFDAIVEQHADPSKNELKCELCGAITWFTSKENMEFEQNMQDDKDVYICESCEIAARGSGW